MTCLHVFWAILPWSQKFMWGEGWEDGEVWVSGAGPARLSSGPACPHTAVGGAADLLSVLQGLWCGRYLGSPGASPRKTWPLSAACSPCPISAPTWDSQASRVFFFFSLWVLFV